MNSRSELRIQGFSGPYFPIFGLNTGIHSANSVFSPSGEKYGPEKSGMLTFLRSFNILEKCLEIVKFQENLKCQEW